MNKFITDAIEQFQDDQDIIDSSEYSIEQLYASAKEDIMAKIYEYNSIDDINRREELKNQLSRLLNNIFYINSKINPNRPFVLDDDLNRLIYNIFVIDQKPQRFDIDEELLGSITVDEGLTPEQATELLRWTSNNTRDNMANSFESNVYNNASLMGYCGYSQFSSLYPLKQLGLDVTINNMQTISESNNHAFGTVTIPIKENDTIVKKRFIVDCTYRQFFSLPNCIAGRYVLGDKPDVGFFVQQNEEDIELAKTIMRDGFVEANDEVLKKYVEPFFKSSIRYELLNEMDKKWGYIADDVPAIIDEEQVEFDYDEEDIEEYGINCVIPGHKHKQSL